MALFSIFAFYIDSREQNISNAVFILLLVLYVEKVIWNNSVSCVYKLIDLCWQDNQFTIGFL